MARSDADVLERQGDSHGPPLVTLLTDFGLSDWYVGAMRAVLARLAPQARVIDLCHGVPPQQIASGAFVLHVNYGLYPKGTTHVAVVDPGVGTPRLAVAVRSGGHTFIGPDNGLLAGGLRGLAPAPDAEGAHHAPARTPLRPDEEAVALDPALAGWRSGEGAPTPSTTFDGRDLFAAAAARIVTGASLASLGTPLDSLAACAPAWRREGSALIAKVVWIDRFGNLVTAAPLSVLVALLGVPLPPRLEQALPVRVGAGRLQVSVLGRTFAAVAPNMGLATIGSCGTLEVVVREGSAAEAAGLAIGDEVIISRQELGETT